MRTLTGLTLTILSACGGPAPTVDAHAVPDAPNDTQLGNCGSAGSGSVSGTVMTETFSPIVRAFVVTPSGTSRAIVLDETAGTGACSLPATGKHLVMAFCDAPTTRTYSVTDPFSCPNINAGGLVEKNGGMDFATGTGGTVTIQGADASCVRGAFNIQFATDTLSGQFNAVVCP